LGRASREKEKPPRGSFKYKPNLTGRPYAGLVGEVINHPTGRARVQIGQARAQSPDDVRFAVFVDESQPKEPAENNTRLMTEKEDFSKGDYI